MIRATEQTEARQRPATTLPPAPPALPPYLLRDLVQVCRPKHWAKNIFVLAPLLFSKSLFSGAHVAAAALAVGCFCLWSSSVYLFNDLIDSEADRRHPRKRQRPIAAGRVTMPVAAGLCLALTAAAGAAAYLALPVPFLGLGVLYLVNSLAYCLVLKKHVIVDVLAIAIGFVLRLLAGCAAIGVEPSSWFVVCGLSLAMVLGFGKRRTEIVSLKQPTDYRPVLESYSVQKLDTILGIVGAVCLLSYILYTVAPETIERHQTKNLVYTVPFVVYGIFRYIFKVQEGKGDGPVEILTLEPIFALNGLMWGLAVAFILFYR
jgi:4-hydroxybenzoate polyprenyltransferase